MQRKFGWKRDLPDHRDHLFAAPPQLLTKLPPLIDLRPLCPPVYDQLSLGSCTANAIAGAMEFDQMQQVKEHFTPSRLFIYYNERAIEDTVNSDAGASIRDGIKSVSKQGACKETTWTYNITKFKKKPSAAAYKEALKYKAVTYQRVTQSMSQMKGCLAAGHPFVFGFTIYDSFVMDATAKNADMPMPGAREGAQGGHAVLCVGYDDKTQRFTILNSWGESFGKKGCFTLPYAYLTSHDLSADFWVIQQVQI